MKFRLLLLFLGSVGMGAGGVYFGNKLVPAPVPPTTVSTVTTTPAASAPGADPQTAPAPTVSTAPAASQPPATTTAPAAGGARIVFAADFASNGGCGDHGTDDACDLFSANLNLSNGAVGTVTRLTNTPESESYPAWNPNGTVAYASVFKTVTQKSLLYVDAETGTTGTLVAAGAWPEVSPDGTTLLYNATDTDTLMVAALSNGGRAIGTPTPLTGVARQEDPDYAKDGSAIVFHQILSDGAHGMVLDVKAGTTAQYADRSGHCAFSGNGDDTVCDNAKGGGLFLRPYANGALGDETLLVADMRPSAIAAYDDAFASCGGTSFNYPTFCGDDTHLLTSVSCNVGGAVSFSRLFLLTLADGSVSYAPIGKALSDAYGGPGNSSWTVDCLPN